MNIDFDTESEWLRKRDEDESFETYDVNTESRSSSQHIPKQVEDFGMLESKHLSYITSMKQLLDSFLNKQKRKPPKKEYIRCKLIRGHKRANRQISQHVIPARTLNRFEVTNPQSVEFWKQMTVLYEANKSELSEICPTEAGPLTDGKKKRVIDKGVQKSFNDKFCKEYFKHPAVKESYYYYVELLFSNFNLHQLCEKFEIFCCFDGHTSGCPGKWQNMKSYMQFDILIALDIVPYGYPLPTSLQPQTQDMSIDTSEQGINEAKGIPEEAEIDDLLNF